MATKKPLLRDLIGRNVKLKHTLNLRSGQRIRAGSTMKIISVWRGRFTLRWGATYVRQISRWNFDLIESRAPLSGAGRE